MYFELLNKWSSFLDGDKVAVLAQKFFESKLDCDFPQFEKGEYIKNGKSLVRELEEIGLILKSLVGTILTEEEVEKMISITSDVLLSKQVSHMFINMLDTMIQDEIKELEWIDGKLEKLKKISQEEKEVMIET